MEKNISRRGFIKLSAASAAALACTGLLAGCGSNSVSTEYKFTPEFQISYSGTSWVDVKFFNDLFSATANGKKMDIQNGLSWINSSWILGNNSKPEFKSTDGAVSSAFKDGGQIKVTVKFDNNQQVFTFTKSGANYTASPSKATIGAFTVEVKNAHYEINEKSY